MTRAKNAGFTLIELIITMVLIGILAVNVLPGMFDQTAFFARGFKDETLALLRYAQKSAIAQHRTVCVAFTSTTASLTIAAAADSTSCNINLSSITGAGSATITAKSGVKYATTPSGFNFDALGRSNAAQNIQIQVVSTSSPIIIETDTGYIHE